MTQLLEIDGPGSRTLGVAEWGAPDGDPVFFLHGTPGSRLRRPGDESGLQAAGLRVITYDRPGYGGSDRHRGRSVVDCVADLAAIADALGLDRFHVTGGSGGGPHSLAAAARMPERVIAAEAVVCPVPRDRYDGEWTAGMDAENVKEFGWALAGEEALEHELTAYAETMLASFEADGNGLDDFDLDEADRELMARPAVKRAFAEAVREAFRPGVHGWVDDDLAMLEPWGFELDEITVPVTLRYGARDVMVPAAHGEWLSRRLPGVRTIVDHEGGHMVPPEEQVSRLVELVRA